MRITRIYTGDDGESHFEDLEVPMTERPYGFITGWLPATGSVGLIYQLVNAFCEPGDEVVYAWRSFEAYPIAVTAGGATSVQVPLAADGRHDLDAMAAAVTDRTRVVIVCTPNNPTGREEPRELVTAVLQRVIERDLPWRMRSITGRAPAP